MGLLSDTIIEQTNVGKSTLFNWFLKSKLAIINVQPSVTRDFLSATIEQRFQIIVVVFI